MFKPSSVLEACVRHSGPSAGSRDILGEKILLTELSVARVLKFPWAKEPFVEVLRNTNACLCYKKVAFDWLKLKH